MKSLGVYYWYVKYHNAVIWSTFYVKKYISLLAMSYNLPLVHDKPLGGPAFVRLVYYVMPDSAASVLEEKTSLRYIWYKDLLLNEYGGRSTMNHDNGNDEMKMKKLTEKAFDRRCSKVRL